MILKNLIRLTKEEAYSDRVNDPIPCEYLRTLLISLVPKDLSVKDKLKWENQIDDTMSCYEEYVNTVCGEALDGVMPHTDKWYEFHSLLKSWDNHGCNYSLHY